MPVEVILDKERVNQLILQGVPTREIAADQGATESTIRSFKCRALRAVRAQTLQVKEESELAAKAERVRAGIADELEHDLAIIKANPAKTIRNVQERQSALSAITGNAKTVFGWGDTIGTVAIDIGLLSASRPAEQPKAIDIQSEQVVDTPQVRS